MQKEYLGKNSLARFLAKLFETFSEVGHSHSKSDIKDFPAIPTKTSQLTNDSGYKTTDNNTTYTLTKEGSVITLSGTDGSSMSVEDTDTKVTVDSALSSSSENPVQNKVINSALNAKVDKDNYIDWFGTGTPIPNDADLNTYETNGKYYASTESIGKSLLNRPDGMNTNFVMWVFNRTSSTIKSQLMITLSGKMYIRSANSSGWRDWMVYTTSDEVEELTESIKQELIAELDTTLTQSGKAADAKAVGDALADKVSSENLTTAVTNALEQAKESGEFKGEQGESGRGISHIEDSGDGTVTFWYTDDDYDQIQVPTPIRGEDYWTADDIAEIEGYIDDAVVNTFGKGTSIPTSADLDSYTTIGKYYASSNSLAQSLTNCPTTQNFMMYVFARTTDNTPSQMIIDLAGKLYLRSRSSTAWRSWVTYITKADLTTAVETALQEAKDSGAFNGTSITHSWDGTILNVTSESGTSSANLKGADGTSVSITNIDQNTSAGGESTVNFSDGKSLKIKNGTNGTDGTNGTNGKSAYEYAQDGGYTGTESEFATKLAENHVDWFGPGISIPEAADLDTYKTDGKYYAGSESRAKTLVNCPTTTNFALYVFDRTTDGTCTQLIITLHGTMFLRSANSSGWRDWVQYATFDNVDTAISEKLAEAKDSGYFGTPVKGVDYWTEEDRASIVQEVIASLSTPVFGTVDENNNIVLTGNLASGTYTVMYEDVDGNRTTIGTISSEGVAYTNQLPIATDENGNIYNSTGYKYGVRWSNSSSSEISYDNCYLSGYIPVTVGDIVRLKNIEMLSDTDGNLSAIYFFSDYGTDTGYVNCNNNIDTVSPVWEDGKLAQFVATYSGYFRICASYIGSDSVITVNEVIG